MVWGAFAFNGKSDLVVISGRMDSAKYQLVIGDQMDTHFERIAGTNFVFQQDNATFHTSASSSAFFKSKGVRLLDWPPKSPDLNPIENLWGYLVRRVYENGRQYGNIRDLREAVDQAWRSIPDPLLKELIDSMKDRIHDLIQKKGRKTRF